MKKLKSDEKRGFAPHHSGLVVLEAVTAENLQGSGFDSPQVHHSLKF